MTERRRIRAEIAAELFFRLATEYVERGYAQLMRLSAASDTASAMSEFRRLTATMDKVEAVMHQKGKTNV